MTTKKTFGERLMRAGLVSAFIIATISLTLFWAAMIGAAMEFGNGLLYAFAWLCVACTSLLMMLSAPVVFPGLKRYLS